MDAFNASDAGNATQNFWRSAENTSINSLGGANRWAVAQAAPFRRMHVIGGLNAYPASYGWASGGYISDSKIDGTVETASQQQWYLYIDGAGKYRVFLPSLRTNASGPSWASGTTAGTSVPMSTFYVAHPGDSAATINTALAGGCNVFFTPGTTNSDTLLKVGPAKSAVSHADNPTTIQDVFFRIGGMVAGKATNSLVVNTDATIIDHTWAWRADHGAGIGWTVNTADTGVIVNGDNVLATGLFVEHYQKNEVIWNGANGRVIFFQNEMPYDPPNQAAWMNGTQNGYPPIKVANAVTTFEAWGLGSYCFFNVNPSVSSLRAFEVPAVAGVKFHNMAAVSLGGVGTISRVINNTAGPANSTTNNVYLVNFP